MALTEREEIGTITVLADGQLEVRKDTVIERDGVEISRTYHRHVVEPGADLDAEDPRVKAVATGTIHTAKVIEDFTAKKAEMESF
jgi:hypothetical protein|tara:strand:- start:2633 stop:2887 length:255 start_codon:yes stop_codon:yes gene_type:complete